MQIETSFVIQSAAGSLYCFFQLQLVLNRAHLFPVCRCAVTMITDCKPAFVYSAPFNTNRFNCFQYTVELFSIPAFDLQNKRTAAKNSHTCIHLQFPTIPCFYLLIPGIIRFKRFCRDKREVYRILKPKHLNGLVFVH